jgi:hypothetical protein
MFKVKVYILGLMLMLSCNVTFYVYGSRLSIIGIF